MIGVVLAGGAGRRMGAPKSSVEVAGVPMAEYVAGALWAVCEHVVSSGGDAARLEVIRDPKGPRHRGPLWGIVSVLEHVGEPILAVAVDQPWVRAATLKELADRCEGRPVIPFDGGIRQVTCAVYTPQFLAMAQSALEGGSSIQVALDQVPHDLVDTWRAWGEDGRSWFSVDTLDDIQEGLRRFGPPRLAGS